MSNKVTYAEIIDALAAKSGLSKQKSEAFSKALIAQIKAELQETGKASITNFGSFKVKRISQRQGQNPQTGEPITIPAHNRVSFTPYKALKETVNAKYAHLETELVGTPKEVEASEELDAPAEENISTGTESRERKKQGVNTGLMLITLLLLVIVAIASVWFLMGPSTENPPQKQALVEQPQSPKVTSNIPEKQHKTDTEKQEEVSKAKPTAEKSPQKTVPKQDERVEKKEAKKPNMYQVKKGEWYWVISAKVYGKSNFWPLIFQENQTLNDDPDTLESSTGLVVPRLEGTTGHPTSSDYIRLAKASSIVSQAYLNFGKKEKAEDYARLAKKWEKLRKGNK